MSTGHYRSAIRLPARIPKRCPIPILWWARFPDCPTCGGPLPLAYFELGRFERRNAEGDVPTDVLLGTDCQCGQFVLMMPHCNTPWWRRCDFFLPFLPTQIRGWVLSGNERSR